jgi:hypothetical protein
MPQVSPPILTGLASSPSSITGPCQTALGKVTLSGKAPAGGVLVSLTNGNAAASVPTVPHGLAGQRQDHRRHLGAAR